MKKLISDILDLKNTKIIENIKGGMMNTSLLVEYHNKKYIFYKPVGNANSLVNRDAEKHDLDIAFKLGISSENIFLDKDSGIKINRYIDGISINKITDFNYEKIALMMHRLHNSKDLSLQNYEPFKRFDEYENERLRFSQNSKDYNDLHSVLFSYKDMLTSAKLVFSHNDAQRSNIIKDLNDNYWIIDFEFSGNNDEIYDIATFGNQSVAEGYRLLVEYFRNDLDENKILRFYLWRMFVSLQWYNVAITKHYNGEGKEHNYNFLDVANLFLENAKECFRKINTL